MADKPWWKQAPAPAEPGGTAGDLADGNRRVGSGSKPYILKNTGGVYSCSCPAWRNQSVAIERRTCKHLRKVRGDEAEDARTGGAAAGTASTPANSATNRVAATKRASSASDSESASTQR